MVRIIGVDFSGAGSEDHKGKTWVTEGHFDGTSLSLDEPYSISRNGLFNLLNQQPNNAVVAMDFPFAVPSQFAQFWATVTETEFDRMPDVWKESAVTNVVGFGALRNAFVRQHGEVMRRGDDHFGGPLSPLKTGGPNMLPMTFRGMRMLHRLWELKEPLFRIPPLPEDGRTGPLLLETMPGVLLRALCLPATRYKAKSKKQDTNHKKVRCEILDGLEERSDVLPTIPLHVRQKCVEDYQGDALDSLVAAIGAALWVRDESQFLHPTDDELPAARLEGWIYAPIFPRHQRG